MKRLGSAVAVCVILLAAVSVFAQQTTNPSTSEPPYGYYHMWDGSWGWHVGMMVAPIMMLLIIVGIVALIVLLVRGFGYGACHHWYRRGGYPHGGRSYGRGALDILEERFAKGEIDKNEFDEKRKLLER